MLDVMTETEENLNEKQIELLQREVSALKAKLLISEVLPVVSVETLHAVAKVEQLQQMMVVMNKDLATSLSEAAATNERLLAVASESVRVKSSVIILQTQLLAAQEDVCEKGELMLRLKHQVNVSQLYLSLLYLWCLHLYMLHKKLC